MAQDGANPGMHGESSGLLSRLAQFLRRTFDPTWVPSDMPAAPPGWEIDRRWSGEYTYFWRGPNDRFVYCSRPWTPDAMDGWRVSAGRDPDDEESFAENVVADDLYRDEAVSECFSQMDSVRRNR